MKLTLDLTEEQYKELTTTLCFRADQLYHRPETVCTANGNSFVSPSVREGVLNILDQINSQARPTPHP